MRATTRTQRIRHRRMRAHVVVLDAPGRPSCTTRVGLRTSDGSSVQPGRRGYESRSPSGLPQTLVPSSCGSDGAVMGRFCNQFVVQVGTACELSTLLGCLASGDWNKPRSSPAVRA